MPRRHVALARGSYGTPQRVRPPRDHLFSPKGKDHYKGTAYDSAYVALAEELGCDLLTADQRLAGAAGPRCLIRVLR